jgi:hypothetical protein
MWQHSNVWDSIKVCRNDTDRSEFHARGNEGHIKFRECLLQFGLESSVILSAIQEKKVKQNHSFVCCFVWVWTSICHIKNDYLLSMLENRVLKKMLGSNSEEVRWELRKLRNAELRGQCCSPSVRKVTKWKTIKWVIHVTIAGKKRNAYVVLVAKRKGKNPIGRPRRRWEDL